MIEEGTILQNRYRTGKSIGQGGMGAVCLATDQRFGSTVAIKETLFSDEHFIKAFKREARLLNSLKHSALPKVSDHFIEHNAQYIVMEYIAGDDLFEMMEKSGEAFAFSDVENWTSQLLDALEYLHGQEDPVIHRDIKPHNLKLTTEGQVILLDFGLAKGNPTDANYKTAATSIFGYSRNYASLEQIQGTGTDPRSDLYSLAATLYHLSTGKPPADALTRVMLVMNEDSDPLVPAHQISEDVPEHFSRVLMQAMSLNANQRPQSEVEMRALFADADLLAEYDNQAVAQTAAGTAFFSQDTKVLAGGTSNPNGQRGERKTQLLQSDSDSVRTRIAQNQTDHKGSRTSVSTLFRSPGYATASIGGLLLLVAGIFAGGYMVSPYLMDETDKPTAYAVEKVTEKDQAKDQASEISSDAEKNTVETVDIKGPTTIINGELGFALTREEAGKKPTADKTKQKSANKKSTSRNTKPTISEQQFVFGDNNKMVFNGRGVKIADGKIIVPELNMVMNEEILKELSRQEAEGDREYPAKPKTRVYSKSPKSRMTAHQYEKLTPAQIMKLTPAQIKKLTPAQKKIFKKLQEQKDAARRRENERPRLKRLPPPPKNS